MAWPSLRRAWIGGLLFVGVSCGTGKPQPDFEHFRHPSGLLVSPDGRFLFVSGGNWDQRDAAGTLMTVDLEAAFDALGRPGPRDEAPSEAQPCRPRGSGSAALECDESQFIAGEDTVTFGDGLGNIALDRPAGDAGPYRLLLPQRRPAALVWADVVPGGDGVRVDCGQDEFGTCDEAHRVRRSTEDGEGLSQDPSRVFVDDQGFRFAYLPHLLGGELTLIDLDGENGPEITARLEEFYREDVFDEFDARGGFAVAGRACDPANPPNASRDCLRPFLYSTHRYWPGAKQFTIAAGLEVVLPGRDLRFAGVNPENVVARPLMGDLRFEDPTTGDALLVLQTSPGALTRVDTSINPDSGGPTNEIRDTVAVCSNPNVLAVHRPPNEEWLALVSCNSDAKVAVVGLSSFSVIASIPVGDGANEIAIDDAREQAYVANTRENTISVISLDRQSPQFLTEWATLGLVEGRDPDEF